jgi:hypothetical protein
MAASEIRRAIIGTIPECLRNCVNKEYFMRTSSGGAGYSEGENHFLATILIYDFVLQQKKKQIFEFTIFLDNFPEKKRRKKNLRNETINQSH